VVLVWSFLPSSWCYHRKALSPTGLSYASALHDPVHIICHMFEEAGTVAGFKVLE
jgi:hypothetical protein